MNKISVFSLLVLPKKKKRNREGERGTAESKEGGERVKVNERKIEGEKGEVKDKRRGR